MYKKSKLNNKNFHNNENRQNKNSKKQDASWSWKELNFFQNLLNIIPRTARSGFPEWLQENRAIKRSGEHEGVLFS